MSEADDRADILANWQRQLRAMDEADTDALAEQFTPDATLTHMTGHVQELTAWMAGIRRGDFVYHQVLDRGVDVTLTGDTALLRGRIVTGVTDDGSGHPWRLAVEQDHERHSGGWLCTASRVTTW